MGVAIHASACARALEGYDFDLVPTAHKGAAGQGSKTSLLRSGGMPEPGGWGRGVADAEGGVGGGIVHDSGIR